MTLIAAFRCTDGIVICADSQETVENRRAACTKIEPFEFGDFDIVIGGSGNNGELIDAFAQQVRDAGETATDLHEIKDLRKRLHEELLSFMKNEAVLYPKSERIMQFMIAASAKDKAAFDVWYTTSSRLVPVTNYKLVGWDEEIYRYSANRLFREPISISRAIPLGMYIFALARSTSNVVGGKTAVLIITDCTRMFLERDYVIEEFETMTEVYATALERMLLACTDTAVSSDEFSKKLAEFNEIILRLRNSHFQVAAKRGMRRFLSGDLAGMSYRATPKGSVVTLDAHGQLEAREDQAHTEKLKQTILDAEKSIKIVFGDAPKPSTSDKAEQLTNQADSAAPKDLP